MTWLLRFEIPRPPGKLVARTRSVGNQNRRIARTGRTHQHRNVAARHIADAGDELAYRPAAAGAEIERRALCTIEQRAYRINVRIRQIGHMDVVAHAGAVCGWLTIAENREVFCFLQRPSQAAKESHGFP